MVRFAEDAFELDGIFMDAVMDPSEARKSTANRFGGSRRVALAAFLYGAARGMCVVCEQDTDLFAPVGTDNRAVLGHNVSSKALGGSKGNHVGYLPGLIANWCHACNMACGDNSVSADDIRWDLVPVEWPNLSGVRKGEGERVEVDAHATMARIAREAKGLTW